jgi:hypothetical protein
MSSVVAEKQQILSQRYQVFMYFFGESLGFATLRTHFQRSNSQPYAWFRYDWQILGLHLYTYCHRCYSNCSRHQTQS